MQSLHSVETSPCAKLNLFLEIPSRRDDGFHEIDTVMVPIDLRDRLTVQRCDSSAGVSLEVQWLPSNEIWQQKKPKSPHAPQASQIPTDDRNLVVRALAKFRQSFSVHCDFHCRLLKGIPAGAGMGGASSDAASALLCAWHLCQDELGPIERHLTQLHEIAASIGSDVPFFLGLSDENGHTLAARARGRGELLTEVPMRTPMPVVVVHPAQGLSTAKVYGRLKLPTETIPAEPFLAALASGNRKMMHETMTNRLTQPAREILPQIDEILESMWRAGLQTCQLTGSGSACFAITDTIRQARTAAAKLRATLQPGTHVWATQTTSVPGRVRRVAVTGRFLTEQR